MHLTFVFMPVALFYFCCIHLPVRENNAYIKPVRGAKKVGDPCSTLPSQRVLCAFALYGLVSYSGSLTLTSSGRYEIHWLNFILKVVAAILAAWLAKSLTSLLAC